MMSEKKEKKKKPLFILPIGGWQKNRIAQNKTQLVGSHSTPFLVQGGHMRALHCIASYDHGDGFFFESSMNFMTYWINQSIVRVRNFEVFFFFLLDPSSSLENQTIPRLDRPKKIHFRLVFFDFIIYGILFCPARLLCAVHMI